MKRHCQIKQRVLNLNTPIYMHCVQSFSCPRHSGYFGRSSGSLAPLDRSIIVGYCRHAQKGIMCTHPKRGERVLEVPVSGSDLQHTSIEHEKMFSVNMSKPYVKCVVNRVNVRKYYLVELRKANVNVVLSSKIAWFMQGLHRAWFTFIGCHA
jgi:hypothetical protein